MSRTRSVILAMLLAGLISAGAAGAAQAATVTVDHPCYYSVGSAQEYLVLTATGFKPGVQVNLTYLGMTFHTNSFTDPTGRVRARFKVPALRGTRNRIRLTASDGTNSAVTRFYVTDVSGDFTPSSGPPSRLRVHFIVKGLGAVLASLRRDPRGTVYAHYIRPNGRLKGTRRFARLSGPCGDLRTPLTRLLPYASEVGSWRIFLDTNRSYRKREVAQVFVGFRVRSLAAGG